MPDPGFIVPLRAMPKYRARTFTDKNSGKTRTAHSAKYSDWKTQFAWHLRAGFKGAPLTGPVRLSLVFSFDKTSQADLDNLAGGVMDAANGILWADDRQVHEIHAVVQHKAGVDSVAVAVGLL